MIGCTCPVCSSPDPRDRRTRSSIYVETPECAWVIDTGTDFRTQCLRQEVRRVDAVVFTHGHTDHIMGFDDLRPFCFDGSGLPVYASPETMDVLRRVYDFAFSGDYRILGYVLPDPVEITGPFSLGKTELVPLPVKHGRANVLGFLLVRGGRKMAAYISDVKEIPEDVYALIADVEVLIVDALRDRPHPTHFSTSDALAAAARARAGKTWFTHICHESGHAATEARLPDNVRIAYDGLKLHLH